MRKKVIALITALFLIFSFSQAIGLGAAEETGDLESQGAPAGESQKIKKGEETYKSSSFTTEQTVDSPSPPFDDYRWWNEDFGWQHTFDPTGKIIISVTLEIRAWDVDYGAGPSWEHDLIYADGNYLGDLTGSSSAWSTTSFSIDSALLNDGTLNIWMNIDSTHNYDWWAVEIDWSLLTVVWDMPLTKDLSPDNGELGSMTHATITLGIPTGMWVYLVDDFPGGLQYVRGTFTVDGMPVKPTVKKGTLSYRITTSGFHVIEFDLKVDEAKNWEDMEVCNVVEATWFIHSFEFDIKFASACFVIHPFEELHKNVGIPKADIVFAIDLTGSMSGEIATVKTEATNIMNNLAAQIADVQFGLISYMDYHGTYSTTEAGSSPVTYTAQYGWAPWPCGDYPYRLDQDITSDTGAMATKIAGLVIGCGSDGPQDYTRIVYESYADTDLHWRTDAERFLILFGDNVPHDTNFDIDNDGTLENRGGDPGPDAILGNADDLDFETEVASAAANDVHIMAVYSGWTGEKYPWTYMASQTDGGYFELDDAEDIPDAITELIKAEAEETLTICCQTDVQWAMVIDVINPYGYVMGDVVITDRFGAEIELDEVYSNTHGSVEITTSKGKSEKLFVTWTIGDLAPGETARLILLVSTDINPAGMQEYTEPGVYEMNSGATLKFIDTEQDTQLSAYTDSIYVTVEEC